MISLLCVDDEPYLLELCRKFLEQYGDFKITTFESAETALGRFESESFDAIVSDYQMPGMDGIAFLKAVRERVGDIPFILFTGRGREEIVIEAINNGADFYLQKGGDPVSQFAELAHKVRQAIRRKKAQDDLRTASEQISASDEELRQQYSELARAEQDVRENQELLRSFLDSATDAFTIWDAGLNLLDLNRAALAYLPQGMQRQDVIGKNLKNFMSGSGEWVREKRYLDVIRTGIPFTGTEQITSTPAGPRWVNIRCFRVGSGLGIATSDITREKEAENTLRESEERNRRVLEQMPIPIALVRDDGTIVFLNNRFIEVFGYTPADIPNLNAWWEKGYPDPEYRHQVMKQWEERVRRSFENHAEIKPAEYRVACKNGEARVVEISGIALGDGFLATFTDNTERKRTEEALRMSEEIQRLFIRHAPAALAMFDTEMHYLAASRRWMLDYHLGDQRITGRSHYEIFPEIPEEIKAIHRRCLAGEVFSAPGDRFERIDGSIQWIAWESRPWYTVENQIGGIIIFSEDITRRRNSEEALRESEEKYRTLIERANEGISIIQDGRYVYTNPRVTEITGIPAEDLAGASFLDLIWPEDREIVKERYTKRMAGEDIRSDYDLRMTGPGGKIRWIHVSVAKIAWQGRPATLNFFTDITNRILAETALRESE